MAGYVEDPSKWRLKTSSGVPYKFVNLVGEFETIAASADQTILIPSNRLLDFMKDMFPDPTSFGSTSNPVLEQLAGFPAYGSRKISFRSQDENLPIDPFNSDPDADPRTYHPIIELNVHYDTLTQDNNDPNVFLEISSNASGDFLFTSAPNARRLNKKPTEGEEQSDDDLEDPNVDPAGQMSESEIERSKPVKNPTIPIVITQPMIEWNVRWRLIPYDLWADTILPRIRSIMGKVNSRTFPFLYNASPETLLFVGWSHNEQKTWRDGFVETPPITLNLKFLEKRVFWRSEITEGENKGKFEGIIKGHNDYWDPKVGWTKIYYDGKHLTHEPIDFNIIFKL